MSEELTPWNDINEDPELVGVFELETKYVNGFSYWDGFQFNGVWSSINKAYANKDYGHEYEKNNRLTGCARDATGWRGLANKPE